MANLVFVEDSKRAIDPDAVAVLDIETLQIMFTSGEKHKLSSDDFQKILTAKKGR